eukprot:gnl/TRDRNA2_/TRDRNA2_195262_c0_seq1.p1 gnl/TRDRNA2_/TRDRNA2_195262_c0~~gnl/TRDRNA2_/TRDRNA2_195262_c0_seq1.p1  ORF type:complete len:286 (+),score=30.89 gnl/TRDRNA2_/TRDRNA2_195262_c0_seq1:34-891(+)
MTIRFIRGAIMPHFHVQVLGLIFVIALGTAEKSCSSHDSDELALLQKHVASNKVYSQEKGLAVLSEDIRRLEAEHGLNISSQLAHEIPSFANPFSCTNVCIKCANGVQIKIARRKTVEGLVRTLMGYVIVFNTLLFEIPVHVFMYGLNMLLWHTGNSWLIMSPGLSMPWFAKHLFEDVRGPVCASDLDIIKSSRGAIEEFSEASVRKESSEWRDACDDLHDTIDPREGPQSREQMHKCIKSNLLCGAEGVRMPWNHNMKHASNGMCDWEETRPPKSAGYDMYYVN